MKGAFIDTTSAVLYHRADAYIPRVAAVHDLCGYGNCSLGVAIPVLSAAGCDVCPVPTGIFSSHTKFPTFYMHDTTSILTSYLEAWKQVNIELDAIYSGFLGSPEQVTCIMNLYEDYPSALRIVDPVMGDAGVIYRTYTPELCCAMKQLVEGADLLTPNITEATILADLPYAGQNLTMDSIRDIMGRLFDMGAKHIVLKGIVRDDGLIRNYVGDQTTLLEISNKLLPYTLHGTGDLFCSSLLGAIMRGHDLKYATEFASSFVINAMSVTSKQPDYKARGVSFESVLGEICTLLPKNL